MVPERMRARLKILGLPEPHFLIPIDYARTLESFQNLSYMGELKQRWQEIKKLQYSSIQATY